MKKNKKKILFITSSRAEYGQFSFLLKKLQKLKKFNFRLIVTGSHLKKNFGNTYKEISKDKVKIYKKIKIHYYKDDLLSVEKSFSLGLKKFSILLNNFKPNLVILPGDRYEIFAFALACFFNNIPIIHFYGGDTSLGSQDEFYRNSISAMSDYHFVSHKLHVKKLINKFGVLKKNIFNIGAISLDKIKYLKLYKKSQIEKILKINLNLKTIVFTYHPVTTNQKKTKKEIDTLLSSLSSLKNINIIFTKPNIDRGHQYIIDKIKLFCNKDRTRFKLYDSLGYKLYFSLIKNSKIVLGNSSSILYEVPYFKKYSINYGDRQKGRYSGKTVINSDASSSNLQKLIKKYLNKQNPKKIFNPYFVDNSTKKSFDELKKLFKII